MVKLFTNSWYILKLDKSLDASEFIRLWDNKVNKNNALKQIFDAGISFPGILMLGPDGCPPVPPGYFIHQFSGRKSTIPKYHIPCSPYVLIYQYIVRHQNTSKWTFNVNKYDLHIKLE